MKTEHTRHSDDRKLYQARLQTDPVDQPARTARTIGHHYIGMHYCSIETVLLIFPFLQTNITYQADSAFHPFTVDKWGVGCN